MFGANQTGDVIMWSSSAKAAMTPHLDYLAARRSQAAGRRRLRAAALGQRMRAPAEVAAAVPMGMVTMIGYGPEANFAENPKAPKWTAKVRYKSTPR